MENDYKCSRGWARRCVEATSAKCTCRCGGHNHNGGKGANGVKKKEEVAMPADGGFAKLETGEIFLQASSRSLFIDSVNIPPAKSFVLRYHSPDGYNWGYGGSGSAQLALAILVELTDNVTAQRLYQDFKWEFIANLEQGKDAFIRVEKIREWLSKKECQCECHFVDTKGCNCNCYK